MSRVDLHLHSTASDGKLTPAGVVAKAAELGMAVIALTDHDCVDGLAPALETARGFPELTVIPGVEISTDMPAGEVHVLGYFLDYEDATLLESLERFRNSRELRAQGMVKKLHDLGVDISWERVQEIAGDGSVGRPHVAEAMMEKGYIKAFEEAFHGYIEHGGPAYVPRDKMTPAEAVKMIVQAKGLPVLAHPYTFDGFEALVAELKPAGLAGIEAHYKEYNAEQIGTLLGLAQRYGLVATGGSDYHALNQPGEIVMGQVDVPMSAAAGLIALAGERAVGYQIPER